MRGRVISFYAMAFFGMQPLGGLLVGSISKWVGTTDTLMGEGVAALLIGLLHWRYLRKEKLKKESDLVITQEQHPLQAV